MQRKTKPPVLKTYRRPQTKVTIKILNYFSLGLKEVLPSPSICQSTSANEISEDMSFHVTKMTYYLLLCIPKRQSPLSYKYSKQENDRVILASSCWVGWQFFNKTFLVGGCQLIKIESHLQEYHNFEEIFENSTRQKSHSNWECERFPLAISKSLVHLADSRVLNPRSSTASEASFIQWQVSGSPLQGNLLFSPLSPP